MNIIKFHTALIVCFFCNPYSLYAETNANEKIYFDPDFIELKDGNNIDLSTFNSESSSQLPGKYYVDIYVNSNLIGAKELQFKNNGHEKLEPCLSYQDLADFNVKVDGYPVLLKEKNSLCIDLTDIPSAKSDFDFNTQRLYLSIPQIAMIANPDGYINLEKIENGINAFLLNYSYSGSNHYSKHDGPSTTSNYVNLRPGINVGAWRFRNYTTWLSSKEQSSKWNTIYTYATRNINQLKSQLMLGDSISPSEIFDSVPFRGVQLATDNEMYPTSLQGYAPTVKGIAQSNAQIIIRQNGYIIYQGEVAAGPFEINDLYPTGSSGDLHVTIKENNGSEQYQIVPFASLPVLQREGRLSYSVTGGQYRAYSNDVEKKIFSQFTVVYGLFRGLTVYGGSQLSNKYQSYSIGGGQNLGDFGAISIDVTQANSTLGDSVKNTGQSYRFRYNKNLNNIGTNIALAGYRYSTKGFYSLAEALDSFKDDYKFFVTERRRNRGEITISQDLGGSYGSLSLTYFNEDYWNSGRKTQSASIGYNNSWNGISYGLNYAYNQNTNRSVSGDKRQNDNLFSLSVSVPFDFFDGYANVNFNTSTSSNSGSNGSIGVSASQLANRLNWSMQQSIANRNSGASGNVNASYQGALGQASLGSGYNEENYNLYYNANGSIVGHSGGITFGQQLNETAVLVEIPEASDVSFSNHAGVKTNHSGYALIPYVSPYRKNSINVDTSTLPENTEVDLTSQTVQPSRGALVKADFKANVGYRALMVVTFARGGFIPFGAQAIFSENMQLNNIVGENGELYLSGLGENGSFIIQYNDKNRCTVHYSLSNVSNYLGLYKTSAVCQ
ncbi:fimbria/pilus outer membrane usher protein [Providencia sp. PROV257]|uniref:fimbria/pilus outer membrane usher protein n=1 Tax=Providencia sp. PROV257 TaxID=2949945 RepID=UPI00234A4F8D|nr:fimbria/pilus outer membrane usher protein [Providencia sp. PROV257]